MAGLVRRLALATGVLALFPVAPATAATGWLPSATLGGADQASTQEAYAQSHDVAMNGRGDVFAAWQASSRVVFSTRPAGGAFSEPQPISGPGDAGIPQMAVNERGDAIVTWFFRDSGANQQGIRVAYRPAGGSFGPPEDVVVGTVDFFSGAIAWPAIDGDGDAVLAVYSGVGGVAVFHSVSAFYRRADTGQYSGPSGLTGGSGSNSQVPGVAMNSRGDAVVLFRGSTVAAAVRPAGHTSSWQSPQPLASEGSGALDHPVVIDDAGNITAMWVTGSTSALVSRPRPVGSNFETATWGTTQTLTGTGETATDPSMAANARGETLAVWQVTSGTPKIEAATSATGGKFGSSVTLASDAGVSQPSAAVDPQGNALAAWRLDGGSDLVQARALPAGGAFGAPADISASGENVSQPQVAMDGEGNGVALWHRCTGVDCDDVKSADHAVRAAGFDGAPPRLSDVAIPGAGTAGSPLEFSASPFDVWGPVTTAWSFGDGATAAGAAVSHTYGDVGSFPVSLTTTDAVGNTASAAGTVNVEPQPRVALEPRLRVSVNAIPRRGTVLVSVPLDSAVRARLRGRAAQVPGAPDPPPGYAPFVRIEDAVLVPIRSIFDVTRGTVGLTTATTTPGVTQTGDFSGGEFKLGQNASGLATLTMRGRRLRCRRSRRGRRATAAARRIRRLSGSARGRFRTRGRYSSATVRGTRWSVRDSCRGTLTRVTEGSVTVRDFRRKRTVVVRAGRRYLARPR